MTNNEKVKQAINKNMASIYSALEQVGATLPEKKNLENVAGCIENINKQQNLWLMQILDLIELVYYPEETYLEIYNTVINKINNHMGLGG